MALELLSKTEQFRRDLSQLPRERLIEIIGMQDPQLVEEVERIEYVFRKKLTHLTWDDGTPVSGRPLTNYELALLIDEPFEPDPDLTAMGISVPDQRKIHISKDTIMWAKTFLSIKGKPVRPRAYQILMLRHPSKRKVFRAGRRLGKSFSLAILLLHYSYTHTDGRCLVIAPMKAHVELIYDEILRLANDSDIVKSSIRREVKSPQFSIEWSNGSTIRFFTSGIRSGGRTDVARGQEAHILVLDELDMMNEEDLVAITAMLQQTAEGQEEKIMVGASTPTGRREVFWNWCHNDRYKEFWFPSYCNPHFDQDAEDEQREAHTETSYRHEIEADWGDDAQGVYPRRFLESAFGNPNNMWPYDTRTVNHVPESFHVFGVDWNKYSAGVAICILEVCGPTYPIVEFRNKTRLIHREETKRDEYTLTDACDRIIELSRIYHPKHIYVDKGYGEMQIEYLHKFGKEHPSTLLHRTVKGIGFGESIDVRDPFTKQKVKKEIKPFMIDNLRQMFERSQIIIPNHDEELFLDLLSYIVARSTPTGRPVFEMAGNREDHAHDALILAALAITENYGELMKVNYARNPVAVSNETFTPTFHLSSDPNVRAREEDIIEEKWGDKKSAPIEIRRGLTHGTRGRKRPIQRRTF